MNLQSAPAVRSKFNWESRCHIRFHGRDDNDDGDESYSGAASPALTADQSELEAAHVYDSRIYE
jgi:hypothetical protein